MNATVKQVFPWGIRAEESGTGRLFDVTHEQITVLAREGAVKQDEVTRAMISHRAFAVLSPGAWAQPKSPAGVPMQLMYENKRLLRAVIRGTEAGEVDVTDNARAMRGIPLLFPFDNTHVIVLRVFSPGTTDAAVTEALMRLKPIDVFSGGFTAVSVSSADKCFSCPHQR
jgi:hypothetical protein